jgi:hypothetical protein
LHAIDPLGYEEKKLHNGRSTDMTAATAEAAAITPFPTVLDRADPALVRHEPFPYIVIDDALPWDVYERLASTYPDVRKMPRKLQSENNKRYNLVSNWGATELQDTDSSPEWRQFIERHSSIEFVRKVYELFPEATVQTEAETRISVDYNGTGLSETLSLPPTIGFEQISARATVAVNTPVRQVSAVRGPHVDASRKAYVGLLYFRHPDDDSSGGDLEVYRRKDGAKFDAWGVTVDRSQVELVDTVGYAPNRLMLMLNAAHSVHAVSPRSVTPHYRRLVVVSGWFPGANYFDTYTSRGRALGAISGLMARLTRLAAR